MMSTEISYRERQERYQSLVRQAWEKYQQGYNSQMASLLEQSLEYTPYLRAETVSDWVRQFVRLSTETSSEFDVDGLSELENWHQLESTIFQTSQVELHSQSKGLYSLSPDSHCGLTKDATWITLSVKPKNTYHLKGYSSSKYWEAPKQAIIRFEFLDELHNVIVVPYKGLSKSEKFGWFSYLPAQGKEMQPFAVKFTTPITAKYLRLGFQTFNNKQPTFLKSEIQLECLEEQIAIEENIYKSGLENFLNSFSAPNGKPFVFIWTGTTYIGKSNRNNRSMKFARLLAEEKIPTIYSYYRWSKNQDFSPYEGGYLFQSPIDLTSKYLYHIRQAEISQPKLLLVSMPDHIAAQHIDSFKMAGWSTLYEVRDEWEEFHKVGQAKWFDVCFEKYIANHADVITTVSPPLKQKMDYYTSSRVPSYVIPNGLSDYFLTAQVRQLVTQKLEKKQSESFNDKKLTIGYFGHLTKAWFDWQLILKTAESNSHWNLEIIGFGGPTDISLPPNVKLLGSKSHQEIVEIAPDWEVAIIPFKPSKLTAAVDPIKVYEYLALGLPVVSSYMAQIVDYPYTYCYSESSDFPDLIVNAAQQKFDMQKVDDFLSTRKWQDRLKKTLSVAQVI